MEYNTSRENLIIPEYGRNVQNMIRYAVSLKDKTERNNAAEEIIRIMGQLNPHLRDVSEFTHMLWDHLFIISNFELDVDSPYPKPTPESIMVKPDPLSYPNTKFRYKHYGKTIPEFIQEAIKMADGEEKEALTESIANMMKRAYLNWNRDTVNDETILGQLEELSEGKLKLKEGVELESTRSILATSNFKRKSSNKGKGKSKKRSNRHKS